MKLIEYILDFMRKSKLTQMLFSAFEYMLSDMRNDSKKTEKNVFAVTADEHIDLHEKDVGLTAVSGNIESRRANVISRLRGWHITTVPEAEDLIKAYGFEKAEVSEDFAHYMFSIKTDAPKSDIFYDMCRALEEIKPAHLAVDGFEIESTQNRQDLIFAMPELIHSVTFIDCDEQKG